MTSCIQLFGQQDAQLRHVATTARASWQDIKGEQFYEVIITPLETESERMLAAMEQLMTRLTEIKSEVDKI
jgi:hypothetical protein